MVVATVPSNWTPLTALVYDSAVVAIPALPALATTVTARAIEYNAHNAITTYGPGIVAPLPAIFDNPTNACYLEITLRNDSANDASFRLEWTLRNPSGASVDNHIETRTIKAGDAFQFVTEKDASGFALDIEGVYTYEINVVATVGSTKYDAGSFNYDDITVGEANGGGNDLISSIMPMMMIMMIMPMMQNMMPKQTKKKHRHNEPRYEAPSQSSSQPLIINVNNPTAPGEGNEEE